ncbi:MAG: cupin domain-containing protein [Halioglobus sp.]|nr:cupin domain-containing protein [Halioglobus sp.]
MKIRAIVALFFLCGFSFSAYGETVLRTLTTWEGDKIVYPQGEPEITSVILKIKEGEVTQFHCHPVPTLGYILKGSLEVETKAGNKMRFNQGDSLVEVMKTVHRGTAIGGTAEAVVFYVGEKLMPNTVLADSDPELIYCDP